MTAAGETPVEKCRHPELESTDIMKLWSKYVVAQSIPEALEILSRAEGPARPISGGTDLLLELQQGRHSSIHTLVDLHKITELNCLETRDETLIIGAGVPVGELTESPLVWEHAQAVAEACGLIGGPQVRNTATLGGNVAHALPAADGMIALVALDAKVEIASPEGIRCEPILDLFKGPGISSLTLNREFITRFYVSTRKPEQSSAFGRVMRPQGVALPIINMAVWMERDEDRIGDIRIAVGPAGPVPRRLKLVEDYLRGLSPDREVLERAKKLVYEMVGFRTSPMRASAAYRHDLCDVLLVDLVERAWQQAQIKRAA